MKKIDYHSHQESAQSGIRSKTLGRMSVLLLVFSMAACTPKGVSRSSYEVEGSKEERAAAVSKLISKASALPGPLLDARFIEEQTGHGQLGPSDFAAFYALDVAPGDLAAWRAALPPMNQSQAVRTYAAPRQATAWWVNDEDFKHLEIFSPKSLTGRENGWVGIAPDGRIFIYAFTM